MFFFLRLAFANIIKNRQNTATIIIAVFISVFFMEVLIGYMDGFKLKVINEALKTTGHVKIFNEKYYNNLDFAPIDYNMKWDKAFFGKLRNIGGVTSVRPEITFGVMANSAESNQESLVQAVDYKNTSDIYDKRKKHLSEGRFIADDKEIMVGYRMAELLKVKTGDSLIMLTMDQYGGINAAEGKICGLIKNNNIAEEESLIICSLGLAQKLLAIDGAVTQVILNIEDPMKAVDTAAKLKEALGKGFAVEPWQTGQAILYYSLDKLDFATFIVVGIVIFVASLGIINSFLMNIMGRLPEFGVLRAMGVGRGQLFMMILAESLILGILGTIAGMLPGAGLVYYFQVNPIDYSSMGAMMNSFGGMDSQVGMMYLQSSANVVIITGVLISVFACIYPALTAINKKPVDILRVLE